jgi:hypothetical protein
MKEYSIAEDENGNVVIKYLNTPDAERGEPSPSLTNMPQPYLLKT